MQPLPDRPERRRLAELAGINEQYLYQCLTGRRDMDAAVAARVEVVTDKAVRRWQLRRDWHKVWPELVGADGAPKLSAKKAAKQPPQRIVDDEPAEAPAAGGADDIADAPEYLRDLARIVKEREQLAPKPKKGREGPGARDERHRSRGHAGANNVERHPTGD
jgi:DNA-binding transcriptional regulator YdaS (Cro superfamily)